MSVQLDSDPHICTHDAVVLTADNVGVAATPTNTDDADGRAGEADQDVHGIKYDAEQAKKKAGSRVAGLFIAISHPTLLQDMSGLTDVTLSQHWMGPVEQELAGILVAVEVAVSVMVMVLVVAGVVVGVPQRFMFSGLGVAAARTTRAKKA